MAERNVFRRLSAVRLRRPSWVTIVLWIAGVALAGGVFVFVRGFVASWTLTSLPGVAVTSVAPNENTNLPTPTAEVVAPEDELPPAWDGASRVTVLFIGLDARDWEAGSGAPRSDSMILFTMDPLSKTAGILSIPRDMWVNIPGFGYSRINTAYSLGEAYKLPGGGPVLAMKTVEQFIGVPIQYYIQVDFKAFEEAIDAMGGLYICIPEKIRVDPIGPKRKQVIDKGCQTLPGYLVLAYARDRKSTEGGDVDRAMRQQLVIMALRDQVLSPENFPHMLAIAPDVYREAAAGLRTNLTFDDMIRLGVLAQQIPPENIKRGIIDYTMVELDSVILGGQPASIFKPIPDKIRVLRDEIFTPGGALSPMATGDPLQLALAEGPRLKVLNGAWGVAQSAGLAGRTSDYLAAQGFTIAGVGDASRHYDVTTLVVHNAKLYTMRYLLDLFRIQGKNQLVIKYDPGADSDIEIQLGTDWALNNPMP
ncbi:MAG: LytR family transcriptional regulator [Anaerolineae bacterium]|nr:MAG: LytR family transcriptional regulator [Anaerolineae bacterium]